MTDTKTFKTKDIYLTSYLVMLGFPLQTLEKKEQKFFSFLFNDSPDLQKKVEEFYNREAIVQPMQYVVSMKQVKSKIYNHE